MTIVYSNGIVLVNIIFLLYGATMAQQEASSATGSSSDWSRCILCQETKTEELCCPKKTRRTGVHSGAGYRTLANNILSFHEINALPLPLDIGSLDEGDGIEATFDKRNAKWHKTCYSKFNNLKLQRAQKRKSTDTLEDPSPTKFTRSSSGARSFNVKTSCFFCETDDDTSGELHKASTFKLDARIRKCALQLEDKVLLAKLSAGDLISQEAVYHSKCLVELYNKTRVFEVVQSRDEKVFQAIALAQLVEYIEETRTECVDNIPVFRLADLTQMYSTRLEQLGGDVARRINSTHLKDRVLANVPGLEAYKKGRDVMLAFNDDVGYALGNVLDQQDFDNDALVLLNAAKIIRLDIMNTKTCFTGSFDSSCQRDSVPESLKTLVGMILGAPDIKTQSSNMVEAQTTLSISQLILFNATKRRRSADTLPSLYHSSDREPPLPVYLGLMTHAETRKRNLVDELYTLGLSISYDRVLAISTEVGNKVCARYESEGVVCPPTLKKTIFTTAAVDNIDHNPSSTTAQGAFHGTGISLFQHPGDNPGEERDAIITENVSTKRLSPLPEAYTSVQPVILPKAEPAVAPIRGPFVRGCVTMPSAIRHL